ncbi:unnamed protein product [Rhizoctonia solani]|uniref:Uncharacterized protein n=1 Tax=Rhizoctonia solani TaxID=456999 RepID=A0A8H3ED68_9AGAM|nr:unnamed protein product [Rhizoctonia solani]
MQAQAQRTNRPIISIPSGLSLRRSRIPRLVRNVVPGTLVKPPPTCITQTFPPTQNQRKRQTSNPTSSAAHSASTAFVSPPVDHVAREGFVSGIPVRSKAKAPSPVGTPVSIPWSSPGPISASHSVPLSPPPGYTARSESAWEFDAADLLPTYPSHHSESPPPPYYPHTPEQGFYAFPGLPEDFVWGDLSTSLTSRNGQKGYEKATFASMQRQRPVVQRPAAMPYSRKPKARSYKKKPDVSGKWNDQYTSCSIEGLDEDLTLDDFSRKLLADVFATVESCASTRAVALSAYVLG